MRLEKASHISSIVSAIFQVVGAIAALFAAYISWVLLRQQQHKPAAGDSGMTQHTAAILLVISLSVVFAILAGQAVYLRKRSRQIAKTLAEIKEKDKELGMREVELRNLQADYRLSRQNLHEVEAKLNQSTEDLKDKDAQINGLNADITKMSELAAAFNRQIALLNEQLKEKDRILLRPDIVPVGYTKTNDFPARRFEIANDGEPAYDLSIPDVKLGTSVVTFEGHCARLTKTDPHVFWRVLIQHSNRTVSTGNELMSEMLGQGIGEMDVVIHYRGREQWYETICKFEVNARARGAGGITIRKVEQKVIPAPIQG